MKDRPIVDVVIPALNERQGLPRVLGELPRSCVRHVVVADNGSTDGTPEIARSFGAHVVHAARRGYGSACLAGLDHLSRLQPPPDVVVFMDADGSDYPGQLPDLVQPILEGRADLVIGSRVRGSAERGALLPQARFGNWLAARMIRALYGVRVTDLGPFRAIRWDALGSLDMRDPDFGWTAEMQVKAARAGLRMEEVPVDYRRRAGRSKITGTVSGTLRAGWKIVGTILRHAPGRRG